MPTKRCPTADQGSGGAYLGAGAIQSRMTFSNKAISSAADFEGLKMRVPEIKTYLELGRLLVRVRPALPGAKSSLG